jgi:hypothetical protein
MLNGKQDAIMSLILISTESYNNELYTFYDEIT